MNDLIKNLENYYLFTTIANHKQITVNLSFLTTHRDRTVTITSSFRDRTVPIIFLPSTYRPATVQLPSILPSHRPSIRFLYFIEHNYVNKLGYRFKVQTVPKK